MGFFKALLLKASKGKEKEFERELSILIKQDNLDFTQYQTLLAQKKQNIGIVVQQTLGKNPPAKNWITQNLQQVLQHQQNIISELEKIDIEKWKLETYSINLIKGEIKNLNYPNLTVEYLLRNSRLFNEDYDHKLVEIRDILDANLRNIDKEVYAQLNIVESYNNHGQNQKDLLAQLQSSITTEMQAVQEYTKNLNIMPTQTFVKQLIINAAEAEKQTTLRELEQQKARVSELLTLTNNYEGELGKKFTEIKTSLVKYLFGMEPINRNRNVAEEFKKSLGQNIDEQEKTVEGVISTIETQLTASMFLDANSQNSLKESLSNIVRIFDAKKTEKDNLLKNMQKDLEEFWKNNIVGFVDAYERNQQVKLFEIGNVLSQYDIHYKCTMEPSLLATGINDKHVNEQTGSWLGGQGQKLGGALVSEEEYIERVARIMNEGLKPSTRPQNISGTNHWGVYFYNPDEENNFYGYGPVALVFANNKKYAEFNGDNESEKVILIPLNMRIKERFDVFIHRGKICQFFSLDESGFMDFVKRLREMINDKSTVFYEGNLKERRRIIIQ